MVYKYNNLHLHESGKPTKMRVIKMLVLVAVEFSSFGAELSSL